MEIPASVIVSSGMHAYVVVKASLHASETSVFGLNPTELNAFTKRFQSSGNVINGAVIQTTPIRIINALGELGYRVISTCGDAEICWTLERELTS